MKKYRFMFTGRQAGAIGIFYTISDTYKAESLSEAKSLLYEDYEHIVGISIYENSKKIDQSLFDAAEFIKVRPNRERERSPKNGIYRYNRGDAPKDYNY